MRLIFLERAANGAAPDWLPSPEITLSFSGKRGIPAEILLFVRKFSGGC
jgi:hypothetical protein